jgi:hypothetical protein
MSDPIRAITLTQFAVERGLTTEHDVQAHIHAGLRSAPTTKTYARWNKRTLAELQDAVTATRAAYRAAIEAGEIREPTQMELLIARANGHEDNPSVHAARRLLDKRGIDWRSEHAEAGL